jgi:ABC-type oligopeptide transport system ATPase subunit
MLLEIKNISKQFRIRSRSMMGPATIVRAVDRVNLSLQEGETFALVGESGSGKTTLGRVIAGLYRADEGEIIYNGRDIRRLSKSERVEFRRGVQMVFQDPYSSLDPRFTIHRALEEAFTLERSVTSGEKRRRMEGMLAAVQLPGDILLRYPHEFSGGERQRIAIARALISRPKLVILDEAVSSLDVLVQDEILKLLADLKAQFGLTYLFISHNLRVVQKISDKIAVMYKGRIVEKGPTPEVFRDPAHPYTQELLTAALDYRARGDDRLWSLPDGDQGRDLGHGHWAMNTLK